MGAAFPVIVQRYVYYRLTERNISKIDKYRLSIRRLSVPDTLSHSTRRGFVLGASAIAALSTTQAAAATKTTRAQTAAATSLLQKTAVAPPVSPPALSMAVANAGGVLWAGAVGKANLEFDVAATPAHAFRIGSVSKIVTTAAAARLVSRGVLDLDAPIAAWLPDLPAAHRGTTLRQLFTHRGGVRHYAGRDLDPKSPGGAIYQRLYPGNKEILAIFIDDPLVGPPGAQVAYSSFGYTLASMAMEAAARRPFTDIVAAEVGAAFDLKSLAKDDPLAVIPSRATGYSNATDMGLVSKPGAEFWYAGRTDPWSNMPFFNPAYCWAGGGFLMSPSDMARFGAALMGSGVTPAERTLLFTPLTEKTAAMPPLGLGWRIDTDGKGRRRYHHAGSTIGGRANLMIYPDQGLSIAIASNVISSPGNVLQPSSDLADIFA
jgi:CubicO group peptidase (beta-lactamase class C family)